MAPERPRSMGYELPFPPRIIERKPESEFRGLSRPARIETMRPGSFLPRGKPELVERNSVEVREPRQPRQPRQPGLRRYPFSLQQPPSDDFVPLPAPIASPRYPVEEEMPILQMRSPRHPHVIHGSSPPPQAHLRHRAPSPFAVPSREVETIRIRRLAKVDRDKADRRRARELEEEVRIERERRRDAGDASRHPEVALRERRERQEAGREAENAIPQRRSAEMVDASLQRDNHRLERERRLVERRLPERRLPERDVALPFPGRQRERPRARDSLDRPEDELRPAPDASRRTREIWPGTDRGAEVIEAAQLARRLRKGERILYYANGRRIDQGRHE